VAAPGLHAIKIAESRTVTNEVASDLRSTLALSTADSNIGLVMAASVGPGVLRWRERER
jgi:hypothetical protein